MPMAIVVPMQPGPEDRDQDQRDQDFREGPGQVDDGGDDPVEDAAEIAGGGAEVMPQQHRERDRERADR